MGDEQQEQQTQAAQAETTGDRWGDPISAERQAELQGYLDRWEAETDHGERIGPFHHERLTGADVFWLAARAGQEGLGAKDTAEDVLRQVTAGRFRALHISQAVKQSFSIIDMSKLNLAGAVLLDAHLEGASLSQAHLEHAYLRHAYLEGAIIVETHFEDADLVEADLRDVEGRAVHLERAGLALAHLERANFPPSFDMEPTHLEGADLRSASLQGALLDDAHCEGALFHFANLTDAALRSAYLGRADFTGATLEGTALVGADMGQVNLRGALLDRKTVLRGAIFADRDRYGPTVVDVRWGDVNLAALDLAAVSKLGDERIVQKKVAERNQVLLKSLKSAQSPKRFLASLKEPVQDVIEAQVEAVRAYRQIASALRRQGSNEDADRFAYRAQVLQRRVFLGRLRLLRYLGSLLLDLISGYGYKPIRSLVTYVVAIGVFAVFYWCVTNGVSLTHGLFSYLVTWAGMSPPPQPAQPLQGYEAVVVSMTSFHGRGFFQPVQSPGDKVAILAACEAAVGLLIEITFIATFTQRFFAR